MSAPTGQGVEGDVLVLEGAGLRVTLDASLFRDHLTGVTSRPGAPQSSESPGEDGRRVVAFDTNEGTVLATEVAGSLTASVHVDSGADQESARHIIRSITHPGDTDVSS